MAPVPAESLMSSKV
jgi:hypothetical protein